MNVIERLRDLFKQAVSSRIIRDSSAMSVASWVSTGISVLTSFALAAILGDEGYGLISIGIALVSTITEFLDIKTSEGLIRFFGNALARGEKREALTFFYVALTADVVLMLATLAAVLLLGPASAEVYGPDADEIRRLVRIYALTIPFAMLQGSFEPILTVMKRFSYLSVGRVLNSIVLTVGLIVGAQFGLEGVMWGYVVGAVVSFLTWAFGAGVNMLRTFDSARGQDYLGAWKQFIPFSFHTSLTASLKAISHNLDVLVLGAVASPAVAGHFRVARSAATLISMPTLQASAVIYPELIEAWAAQHIERARRLVYQYTRISGLISLAAYAFFLVTADWLVALFYSPDFAPVGNLIRILGFGITLDTIFRWVRPATMAAGKPQVATVYNIGAVVAKVVLLVPLAYLLGAVGAAIAFDATIIVTVLMMVFYALPRLGLGLRSGVERPTSVQPDAGPKPDA
ncbi:MAG TPA: oligosaccharide flippase family protein [Aggregatilineales bacterium]|nr:oligosaccharide flippase family protein [Aggregatilineales bacterium]